MHCAGLCGAVPRLSSMAHPFVTLFFLVSATTRHRTISRLSHIKMRVSSPLCVHSVCLFETLLRPVIPSSEAHQSSPAEHVAKFTRRQVLSEVEISQDNMWRYFKDSKDRKPHRGRAVSRPAYPQYEEVQRHCGRRVKTVHTACNRPDPSGD